MTIDETLDRHLKPLSASLEDIPRRMIQSAEIREYERIRTRKIIRLPVLTGTAVGGVLIMGGDTGEQLISPEEGYIWSLRELNVEGLTASASAPDVVNFYRNQQVKGKIFWQLNGNVFAQTWSIGEKILFPGDNLLVVSLGAFASTAQIVVSGTAFQVTTERQGEFF